MFPAAKLKATRVAVVGGLAASSVLVIAGTASAHVTVQPSAPAPQGGSAVIDFKVPNERDNARTSKLEVDFPTDHPLSSVQPAPVPGWKIDITTSKLSHPVAVKDGGTLTQAVTRITWTADAADRIPEGEFQMFPVSLSGLPSDADQVVFKALQTYDSKEVVRWIEVPRQGQPEPPNPAPVLKLAPASATGAPSPAAGANGAAATADRHPADTAAASDGTDTVARILGVVGIVAGAAGVTFGVVAGRRRTA